MSSFGGMYVYNEFFIHFDGKHLCHYSSSMLPQCQNHINALPLASIYVYTFLQVSNDHIKMRGLFICHICNWWCVMIIDILQVWRRDEM